MNSKPNHNQPATLSPADAQALDMLLEASPASAAPQHNDPRVQQLKQILELLDQHPVMDPSADLTQKVLGKIKEEEQRRELAMQIQSLAAPTVAFRWREMFAVAAVLLMGLSVLWPTLAASREEARRLACQYNLGLTGMAMARYATDHQGLMPRTASLPSASWASVGMSHGSADTNRTIANRQQISNPAHLFLLARQGYITPQTMACPDNSQAPQHFAADSTDWPNAPAVSFSYQNQLTPKPLRLDRSPDLAVLADKNPLFVATRHDPRLVVFRTDLQPASPSPSHKLRGQNILFASGATLWNDQPVTRSGDNIWTAQGVRNYIGTESPTHEDDSFLVP
ncbi:MAG: hypothetical protein HC898_08170 [Phycisphaerales bacterium]|nr:hypothetical protein [Phycisphaerales bacterium]